MGISARLRRSRLLAPLLTAGLGAAFVCFWTVLAVVSGVILATLGAFLLTATLAVYLYLFVFSARTRRLDPRRRSRLTLVCWAVTPAIVAVVALTALGLDLPLAVAGAAVAGASTAVFYAGRRPSPVPPETVTPNRPQPVAPPPEPGRILPPGPNRRLEQARAALSKDDVAGIETALPLLREAIADPAVDRDLALQVVDALVGLESERAEKSREDRRYAEAIKLLTELVLRHPNVRGGKVAVHSHRAQYLMFQAARLGGDRDKAQRLGDEAAMAAAERRIHDLYLETETELRHAVAAAPKRTAPWARESVALGVLLCRGVEQGEEDRADDGIALLRRALDGRVPLSAEERTMARLDLAMALSARAQRTGSRDDVPEVRRLLGEVAAAGPEFEAATRPVLAGLP